jgi:hypothetical protein
MPIATNPPSSPRLWIMETRFRVPTDAAHLSTMMFAVAHEMGHMMIQGAGNVSYKLGEMRPSTRLLPPPGATHIFEVPYRLDPLDDGAGWDGEGSPAAAIFELYEVKPAETLVFVRAWRSVAMPLLHRLHEQVMCLYPDCQWDCPTMR